MSVNQASPKLLNLGCGSHFHLDWTNLDFVSQSPHVQQHDLRKGLPEASDQFDMVYHSHVLEHFAPQQGQQFLAECYRVLKPGGVLRIAVPDLEQIAQLYLQYLNDGLGQLERDNRDDDSLQRYHWMKLELLDQMTRHQSGGSMGPFMVQATGAIQEFIDQRLGRELEYAKKDSAEAAFEQPSNSSGQIVKNSDWRKKIARKVVKWLLGREAVAQMEIGNFRDSGEVHRWMYDRLSLRLLCSDLGFEDYVVRSAEESYLPHFESYELDTIDGRVRKPDSLFIECRKPRQCVADRRGA